MKMEENGVVNISLGITCCEFARICFDATEVEGMVVSKMSNSVMKKNEHWVELFFHPQNGAKNINKRIFYVSW